MKFKKPIIKLLNKLPYIRTLYSGNQEYLKFLQNSCFPAGHFYSPIISVDEVRSREKEIWDNGLSESIPGIEMQVEDQKRLIGEFLGYHSLLTLKKSKDQQHRYYYENEYYGYTDGIILCYMLRHYLPKRIIEIGSGFSSAIMLDCNEKFYNSEIELTFIDPNPERLFSVLHNNEKNKISVIAEKIQNVELKIFSELQSGDILFIDSSHIVKTGSDVNFILFNILPSLKSGVLIHFHDILYPFEYPKKWVFEGRNWNENYFLRSFLMYNEKYKIIFFSDFLFKFFYKDFEPLLIEKNDPGSNIWLQKM